MSGGGVVVELAEPRAHRRRLEHLEGAGGVPLEVPGPVVHLSAKHVVLVRIATPVGRGVGLFFRVQLGQPAPLRAVPHHLRVAGAERHRGGGGRDGDLAAVAGGGARALRRLGPRGQERRGVGQGRRAGRRGQGGRSAGLVAGRGPNPARVPLDGREPHLVDPAVHVLAVGVVPDAAGVGEVGVERAHRVRVDLHAVEIQPAGCGHAIVAGHRVVPAPGHQARAVQVAGTVGSAALPPRGEKVTRPVGLEETDPVDPRVTVLGRDAHEAGVQRVQVEPGLEGEGGIGGQGAVGEAEVAVGGGGERGIGGDDGRIHEVDRAATNGAEMGRRRADDAPSLGGRAIAVRVDQAADAVRRGIDRIARGLVQVEDFPVVRVPHRTVAGLAAGDARVTVVGVEERVDAVLDPGVGRSGGAWKAHPRHQSAGRAVVALQLPVEDRGAVVRSEGDVVALGTRDAAAARGRAQVGIDEADEDGKVEVGATLHLSAVDGQRLAVGETRLGRAADQEHEQAGGTGENEAVLDVRAHTSPGYTPGPRTVGKIQTCR